MLITFIILLLVASAFTSGTETAMTAVSRERFVHMADEGNRAARQVVRLLQNKEQLIGALLIGNNLVNILLSALTAIIMERYFGDFAAPMTALILTPIVVIFSEVLPKTYAIRHSDRSALSIAPFARFLVVLLAPLAALVHHVVNLILRLTRAQPTDTLDTSLAAIRGAIALHAQEGTVDKQDRDMLASILDLRDIEVADIMTHRRSMITLNADAPIETITEQVLDSAYTRLPVWRGDPDQIIGVLHVKDFLYAMQRGGGTAQHIDIAALAIPPWFVPDTTPLSQQLRAFRERRLHLAVVIDEYGALQGLVTLEDVLEEIVGDIADETDVEVEGVQPLEAGGAQVEGTVTVRDLNRQFDWRLPDDDAATVAGLVIHDVQRIPEEGEAFELHDFRFEIKRRTGNQITLLTVVPLERAPAEDED